MSEFKKVIKHNYKDSNSELEQRIIDELKNIKLEGAHKHIEFDNIEIKPTNYKMSDIGNMVANKKYLGSRVYATARVVNKRTGTIEDEKKIYLGKIPQKNELNTYIIDGNHYTIPNQFRLKPGAYTSIKNSGDIETMFNTADGPSMKIISPVDKDDVYLNVAGRKYNMYDVLKLAGATDDEIKKKLGDKIYALIKSKSNPEHTLKSLAEKLEVVSKEKALTSEGQKMISEALLKGKLDREAIKDLIGIESDKMNKDVLLNALYKNIQVKKGKMEADDKDNLIYKKVVTPEKLIAQESIKKFKQYLWKNNGKLNSFNPLKVEEVINKPHLTDATKNFMTTSAISRMPEGYNPLQLIQANADITPLGEGGIKSTESITPSNRSVHLSQLGFIDPIKSPEGANTGITLSLTENAFVDNNGNPAIAVKNLKTGKYEIKRLKDLWDKKIAFPDPENNGKVGIRYKNKIYEDHISKADYQLPSTIHMFGPAMNSLGAVSANDLTRNLMASKHILQALPLKERDIPSVTIAEKGMEPLKEYARGHLPESPANGTVESIDKKNGEIIVRGEDGKKHKVPFSSDLIPLNAKTYIQHIPTVKPGDKVKKGQFLAESNYTKDGHLALGKNLRTAFMMYPGTRNDAFVVSESAAKKMTSVHMHKEEVHNDKNIEFSKSKFVSLFPQIAQKIDLDKYDEKGFLKSGVKITKGEPVFLAVKELDKDEVKFANEKVRRLLHGGKIPYMPTWKYSDPAELDKINADGRKTRVYLKYESPLKVGDKVAGRSGNKGIISKIIPDDQMPRDEDGKPIDIIMGGAGIASRQNPAQVIEATLGEVSRKTGKTYKLPPTLNEDLAVKALNEAKKHNVKLYHKIYDPVRKEYLKQPVFVGTYHIQKLFKQGESGYSAIGYGPTDNLDQPKKGGKTSASSISNMEVNALLTHGAKDFLRETFKIRSQKNRDWFNAFMRGDSILPAPEEKTSLKKFRALLQQINMDTKYDGDVLKVVPLTDKDVLKLSNGEVKEPFGLVQHSLKEVKKGYYDPSIFGGDGNYYGHIDLKTKIINPNYKDIVATALGMTGKKLDQEIEQGKFDVLQKQISKINLNSLEKKVKQELKNTKNLSEINKKTKLLKAIKKLKSENINPTDAFLISKIPVLPTKYRPVAKLPNGGVLNHDINEHYSTIINAAKTLEEAKKEFGDNHELTNKLKTELQYHVGALFGTNKPVDPVLKKKEVKSVPDMIAGKKPKESLWQRHVLQNKVFTSGRAVIIPNDKYLGMDEVELPKEVAWKIFEPHVKRKMAQTGMSMEKINEEIENKTPVAEQFLHSAMKEIPVVINRAPTLHKHNMTAHYAKISPENAMKISPLIEPGHNADYDGDQMAIHVPLTQEAINDTKEKLLASKQLFGARHKDQLVMKIDLDPYIGFYHATKYKDGIRKPKI